MSLDFPNVAILGLDQESRFFNGGFNYSNLQKINIEGLVIDLTNGFGVSGMWSGVEGIVATVANNANFQPLTLNGYSFGSGRIQNINFGSSVDVRTKTYNATLICYNTGNLFNFNTNNGYYSGIDITNFQFLESFNENYNFTRKLNGGYNYNHSANITLNSGLGTLQSIPESKNIVTTLFTGSQLGFLFYSGFTNVIGKRFYTEAYNLIDNSCSFNESFDFDDYTTSQPSLAGTYSSIRTNSYEMSENGTISVVENGTIKGITYPTYLAALSALTGEMTGAFLRCSGIFTQYSPPNSTIFINSPITQGRTFDIFNNVLTYSIVFSNSPNNFGGYFWDYNDTIDRENGIIKIIENGQILGKNENRITAFQNALQAYSGIKNFITPRIQGLFFGVDPTCTFFLEAEQDNFNPYKSSITYNYQYTNEQVMAGVSGVKKITSTFKDNYGLYSFNKINIFNVGEIVQNNYQSTLGSRTASLTLIGEKIVSLNTYLGNAQTGLNNYIPNPNAYLVDAGYSYNPDENTVIASATWHYPIVVQASPYLQ